jgi:hypothetical protein
MVIGIIFRFSKRVYLYEDGAKRVGQGWIDMMDKSFLKIGSPWVFNQRRNNTSRFIVVFLVEFFLRMVFE